MRKEVGLANTTSVSPRKHTHLVNTRVLFERKSECLVSMETD
jgi:hypothetical protein